MSIDWGGDPPTGGSYDEWTGRDGTGRPTVYSIRFARREEVTRWTGGGGAVSGLRLSFWRFCMGGRGDLVVLCNVTEYVPPVIFLSCLGWVFLRNRER